MVEIAPGGRFADNERAGGAENSHKLILLSLPTKQYIIRIRHLVGRDIGCRTLAVFKGAVFPSMRNPLRRYYGRGDLHFVTFSCYRRRPFLATRRARDVFVRILDEVRLRHEFQLIGFVVMPEHIHLLMSEPRKGDPSKSLQVIKQRVSRALRKRRRRALPGQMSLNFPEFEAKSFWQRRFYDFNVWSAAKLKEKLEYMHANPVKRKLVTHPKDWPWSSWSHYEKGEAGLIRID
jgi:putative transposase